ncbi:MAG: ABC transporter substrate-binding protein [Thermoanaerobaculia bacterium]
MRRIVSLLPSATEIVHALGLGEELVGRSHQCDFPPEVARLPALTRSKIRIGGWSAQIHADVTRILENALGVYEIDRRMLELLRPTHVITQVQCDVCAVSLADVEEALGFALRGTSRLIALRPTDLAGVLADIRAVGAALEVPASAERCVALMEDALERVRSSIARVARRPRVVCLEWLDPLMLAGNWMPELVRIAGGDEQLGRSAVSSSWIGIGEVAAADPDVIILIPCGFSLERIEREAAVLGRDSNWRSLRAVRDGAVYAADGNQFFNRPGPRLVDSAVILREILHPAVAPPIHRGRAWSLVESCM